VSNNSDLENVREGLDKGGIEDKGGRAALNLGDVPTVLEMNEERLRNHSSGDPLGSIN
jgi:hypothetical protein